MGSKAFAVKSNVSEDILKYNLTEATAQCPHCKAFQTISFMRDKLVETRKFSQKDGQVWHDCGSVSPCRILRGL